jgi:hypothetical protein
VAEAQGTHGSTEEMECSPFETITKGLVKDS